MNKHTLPGFDSPVMMYQYYCLTFTYESLQQRQQRGQHNLPQFSSLAVVVFVVVLCHIYSFCIPCTCCMWKLTSKRVEEILIQQQSEVDQLCVLCKGRQKKEKCFTSFLDSLEETFQCGYWHSNWISLMLLVFSISLGSAEYFCSRKSIIARTDCFSFKATDWVC